VSHVTTENQSNWEELFSTERFLKIFNEKAAVDVIYWLPLS
jgi:hypothetical protein